MTTVRHCMSSPVTRSPNSSRTCCSSPHSGAGDAPGGGGGANGCIVAKSRPMKPCGVQLIIPMMPPGRQTRISSSATTWCRGANIAPTQDVTTSNIASGNGSASASASTHCSSTPRLVAIVRPASNSSGVRSDAVTVAPRWAAATAALPEPAPTSSTRSPARIRHACTSAGPSAGISSAATAG